MRFLPLVFLLVACQPAPVGVQNVELRSDSAARCSQQCAYLQLELESVVVMANNVGCVCRPPPPPMQSFPPGQVPPATSSRGGASGAAGMVAIQIQREAEEAARRRAPTKHTHRRSQK